MVKLKVDFSMRNLSVPVNIWSKSKNRFEEIYALFDTGAHTCAIDTMVLSNLGYDLEGAMKSYISTASDSLKTVRRVRIDKIMLDKTPFDSVLFNTFEFPIMSRPIIIGLNLIRQFEININSKSRIITMNENYLDKNDDYYDADIFGDWRADSL